MRSVNDSVEFMIPSPTQLIYYGAPGTGKSYLVDERTKGSTIIRVTIHPEFTYSDFVGQLLPIGGYDGGVSFRFVEGPMTIALRRALEDRSRTVCLVLEELSRGNVAAIFGDLFQLLDRDPLTGNSRYFIFNRSISEVLPETEENVARGERDTIFLPANLNILATVNVSDQNVLPMDTAFKRRFEWQYVSTNPVKAPGTATDDYINNPKILLKRRDEAHSYSWVEIYTALNQYITNADAGIAAREDKQIGQFFLTFSPALIEQSNSGHEEAQNRITEIFRNKLLMYLWEDVESQRAPYGQNGHSLFDSAIQSFNDLYSRSKDRQIFSDYFFDNYLDSVVVSERI